MLQGWIQIGLTLVIILAITPIFGGYIARVYLGQKTLLDRVLNPVERLIFSLSGVSQTQMTGWQYARAVLYSNLAMAILLFAMLMLQGLLPLNPTGLGAPTWDTALHTTISFMTNTDQQHYSGAATQHGGEVRERRDVGGLALDPSGDAAAYAFRFGQSWAERLGFDEPVEQFAPEPIQRAVEDLIHNLRLHGEDVLPQVACSLDAIIDSLFGFTAEGLVGRRTDQHLRFVLLFQCQTCDSIQSDLQTLIELCLSLCCGEFSLKQFRQSLGKLTRIGWPVR